MNRVKSIIKELVHINETNIKLVKRLEKLYGIYTPITSEYAKGTLAPKEEALFEEMEECLSILLENYPHLNNVPRASIRKIYFDVNYYKQHGIPIPTKESNEKLMQILRDGSRKPTEEETLAKRQQEQLIQDFHKKYGGQDGIRLLQKTARSLRPLENPGDDYSI